jgi:large subunit ribosomal protein L10
MALTKDQKNAIVSDTAKLLAESKLTVLATYPGTSVSSMQQLRSQAKDSGTTVKVIKNRLVLKALEQQDKFKSIDKSVFKGQMLYAFNNQDETAPAQVLAKFSKKTSQLDFIAGIMSDGTLMSPDDVKSLADLPTKDQLRSQLAGLLNAPASGFVRVLSGNLRGVMNALNARSKTI